MKHFIKSGFALSNFAGQHSIKMDFSAVYRKTPKGLRAKASLIKGLPSFLMKVLTQIDGTTKAEALLDKLGKATEQELASALTKLENEGYIKQVIIYPDEEWHQAAHSSSMVVEEFQDISELEAKAQQAEEQSRLEARQAIAKAEAEARVRAEIEAEARARVEEAARLKAEEKARIEAEKARTKAEAEEKVRLEIERAAHEEGLRKAEAARLEAQRKGQEEKERAAREEEARLKAEAEARTKAEEAIRLEAGKKARIEAEEARLEAERAAMEAAARLKAEARTRAKAEAEEKARLKAEEKARDRAEKAARLEAKRKARLETKEKARIEAEKARTKAEAEEKVRLEAERAAREKEARRKAEATARLKAERKNQQEKERIVREEEARLKAEAKARAKAEAEEKARVKVAEKARVREEKARAKAEKTARSEVEKKARLEARRIAREGANLKAEAEAQLAEDDFEPQPFANEKAQALLSAGISKARRLAYSATRAALIIIPLIALLLAVALPYVPLVILKEPVEKAAEEALGEPVTVGQIHADIWPIPHFLIKSVSVGSPALQASAVKVVPEFSTLFAPVKRMKSIEIEGLSIGQEHFGRPVKWISDFGKGKRLKAEQIMLSKLMVRIRDMDMEPLDGTIVIDGSGALDHIDLTSQNNALTVAISPRGADYGLLFKAENWPLPLNPGIIFTSLSAQGSAIQGKLNFKRISGEIYGGKLTADAFVDWSGQWAAAGNFNLVGASSAKLLSAFGSTVAVEGKLDLAGNFSSKSAEFATLRDTSTLNAVFTLSNGSVNGIELTRAVLGKGRQSLAGDATHFDKLTGSLHADGARYHYRRLVLKSPQFGASGNLDISPSQEVSGRISAVLATPSRRLQSDFGLAGTTRNIRTQ